MKNEELGIQRGCDVGKRRIMDEEFRIQNSGGNRYGRGMQNCEGLSLRAERSNLEK